MSRHSHTVCTNCHKVGPLLCPTTSCWESIQTRTGLSGIQSNSNSRQAVFVVTPQSNARAGYYFVGVVMCLLWPPTTRSSWFSRMQRKRKRHPTSTPFRLQETSVCYSNILATRTSSVALLLPVSLQNTASESGHPTPTRYTHQKRQESPQHHSSTIWAFRPN